MLLLPFLKSILSIVTVTQNFLPEHSKLQTDPVLEMKKKDSRGK
jgi:hypothetical protein